jgi:glycosyltransferase involved in cell wall biosynthesis
MSFASNFFLDLTESPGRAQERFPALVRKNDRLAYRQLSAELLRQAAWETAEQHLADAYVPPENHVGLAMVTPYEGFAHWRILPEWVEQTAKSKGDGWHHCRLVLRLYDVAYIQFNGFNAHRIQDECAPALVGQTFFKLPKPGTWQLAEVGFLLRSGEFVPAARSPVTAFAPDAPAARASHEALLVTPRGDVESVSNIWDQEQVLWQRRKPRVRHPLRVAFFTLSARITGHDDVSAHFASELAVGQAALGHEIHVFMPNIPGDRDEYGVHYHQLPVNTHGSPLAVARAFSHAAREAIKRFPAFDLVHSHEWMAGLVSPHETTAGFLSLTSIETTRRNGNAPCDLSRAIEEAEREAAHRAACILTPDWLCEKAKEYFGLDEKRVRAFPMEGRMPNEWECPIDTGRVKMEIGFGPFDRLVTFIGPMEYAAGPDLLLEALPVLLRRCSNLRLAFVGAGDMLGHIHYRAGELGISHAVRILGHTQRPRVVALLRSSEALVLPSRYRVPLDDAVVDLARLAGKSVVTTHGGPAHLVKHEENGIVTYDNPGSVVWAVDRIVGDPDHSERLGRNGKRRVETTATWKDIARHYLDLCASVFPDLSENSW